MSLAELRARTRPLHQRLDSRLDLFSTVHSREQYREHLYRFYQILFHLEEDLVRFSEWRDLGIRWEERRKIPLLRTDLLALGCEENLLDRPERPASLPPLGTFAESVGSFYVLEGSTLGAQYISKHFGQKLGLTPESGMAFHSGYGPETRKKWEEFCTALEKFFENYPEKAEQALHSACAAFSSVEENLCAPSSPTLHP
jgi:heme oxygenase